MKFIKVQNRNGIRSAARDAVFLTRDSWDDYGFRTTFGVVYIDHSGRWHDLKRIHIGFSGQTESISTYEQLPDVFDRLPEGFFSLCSSAEYYKIIRSDFSEQERHDFLHALNDLVYNPDILSAVINEPVVRASLLRSVNVKDIRDQFASVLRGEVSLTDFNFGFSLSETDVFAGFDLQFKVEANSLPNTNMHAIIGRNGVGKTTYLSSMIKAATSKGDPENKFYQVNRFGQKADMDPSTYFGSLVSVAFSAFDPFDESLASVDAREGIGYSYIGLTNYSGQEESSGHRTLKSEGLLHGEFVAALRRCFESEERKVRWLQTVSVLEADENFSDMNLSNLAEAAKEDLEGEALSRIQRMSSGHTIVILSMTLLVASVEEKTLVLFDEPESHLQPPLLSALIRALGQLLRARNAVAIIATHSPVVLQEIPKSCVWKVSRLRRKSDKIRPEIETFGENVGTLTRDVFKLDVAKSGFHTVLAEAVKNENPKSMEGYDTILNTFKGALGYEAKGILKALVANHLEREAES